MAKKGTGKTTETGAKRGRAGKVEALRSEEAQRAGGAPTHAQIAQRAQQIWERRGRLQGQDEKNWRDAEEELKREMGH